MYKIIKNFVFRFPKDTELRQQWAKACRRIKPDNPMKVNWIPGEYTYLCSNHFHESDFDATRARKCLNVTAVPSIFSFSIIKEPSSRCTRYTEKYLTLSAHVTPVTSPNDVLYARSKRMRDQLRNAGKREKRLRLSLESVTEELKNYKLITAELQEKLDYFKGIIFVIRDILIPLFFTDMPTDMFEREHNKYSDRMRNFALTLHLYGSKAYDYVRKIMPLPHPKTLCR